MAEQALVLYASQTGTAESVARRLEAIGPENQVPCRVHKMNEFKQLNLQDEPCVIFVVATTGDGETPENGARFTSFVSRKSHPAGMYAGCRYAVLGLGDTNYNQFCKPAITIDRRMSELGGIRIAPLALADDGTDMAEVIEPWFDSIWKYVKISSGVTNATEPAAAEQRAASVEIEVGSAAATAAQPLVVFWGGEQGGQADACVKQITADAQTVGCVCSVWPGNHWKKAEFDRVNMFLLVVCTAKETTDPPDNINRFFNLLKRKSTQHDLAEAKQFATVVIQPAGLDGIAHGLLMDAGLERLGGQRMCEPLVLESSNQAFDPSQLVPWLHQLWPQICPGLTPTAPRDLYVSVPTKSAELSVAEREAPASCSEESSAAVCSNWLDQVMVTLCGSSETPRGPWWSDPVEPQQQQSPLLGRLVAAQLLTAKECHDRVVWSAELSFNEDSDHKGESGSSLTYQPGDAVGIWPRSPADKVLALLSSLELEPDQLVSIQTSCPTPPDAVSLSSVQWPQTVSALFTHVYDVAAGLSLKALEQLALHCTESTEAVNLRTYCNNPEWRCSKPTLLDIAARFPSLQLSLQLACAVLPTLQPRYYSVASSPLSLPGSCVLAFSVVKNGLCTPWLHQMCQLLESGHSQHSEQLPFFWKRATTFALPADTRRPIVMVGPGTGVAPFIGFLDHLKRQRNLSSQLISRSSHNAVTHGSWGAIDLGEFGLEEEGLDEPQLYPACAEEPTDIAHGRSERTPVWLFTGFRNRALDYLYQSELEAHLEDKTLTELQVAFSRDQPEKVYVQHKIAAAGEQISNLLLEQGGYLFVCGDGNHMARDVRKAVQEVFVVHGELCEKEAKKALNTLVKEQRFVMDIWST